MRHSLPVKKCVFLVGLALVWNIHGGEPFFSTGSSESTPAPTELKGFQCLTEMTSARQSSLQVTKQTTNGWHEIRSFRLAVAATGEYTEFHGGTVPLAMAAISNVVHRVNEIYEHDMGIRLLLVTNNARVVYTNKTTDPFTSNNPDTTTIGQAQTAFDQMIGNDNYDLGILLTTGSYGLAYLHAVCDSQIKGRACMGLPQPTGEIFYVLVAHEMAHQFGATHTFNDNTGFCSGNRFSSSAMEPGTGSTLLSYAGLGCGPGVLQPFMDGYFHARSIDEIESFIEDTTLCGTIIVTSNHPPTVVAGPDYVIPRQTPFQLAATGSDPDGDPLTYCWEQMDVGPPQTFSDPDNGTSPLFRSFPPTTNSARIFPKLSSILQNTNSLGEKLPTTNRVMRFRVTVRDSQQMGAKGSAETHVQVAASAGPFRFSSHNTSAIYRGLQTLQWDVAGTDLTPVNVAHVNLLLSTNGGQTFSIALATNTLNDGSETIAFPSIDCANARLKIEAVESIFFDINDANFTLTTGPIFTAIQKSGGNFSLRWARDPAKSYQLQATSTLKNPDWQPLAVPITPSGSEMQATVSAGSGPIFFRVREF